MKAVILSKKSSSFGSNKLRNKIKAITLVPFTLILFGFIWVSCKLQGVLNKTELEAGNSKSIEAIKE
jgi:hypothetical protein